MEGNSCESSEKGKEGETETEDGKESVGREEEAMCGLHKRGVKAVKGTVRRVTSQRGVSHSAPRSESATCQPLRVAMRT